VARPEVQLRGEVVEGPCSHQVELPFSHPIGRVTQAEFQWAYHVSGAVPRARAAQVTGMSGHQHQLADVDAEQLYCAVICGSGL
jgi:hypothetical protein